MNTTPTPSTVAARDAAPITLQAASSPGSRPQVEVDAGDAWGVVLVFTVAVAMMALCALTTTRWK